MIKEGRELVCQAFEKGKCIITSETRNNCKACRYQRCLDAKMDLHRKSIAHDSISSFFCFASVVSFFGFCGATSDCRIGRQSNLFKQNLKNKLSSNHDKDFNSFNQVINQIVMINSPTLDTKNSSTDFDYEPQDQHHEMSSLNEFERRLLKKACEAHDCFAKQLPALKVRRP